MSTAASAPVTVCFTPAEKCVGQIVAAIGSAESEIRVQAYGFTSPPILAALVAARKRGVDVRVILDKSNDRAPRHEGNGQEREAGIAVMAAAGVPVWIDYRPAIAHNKVIVIDHRLVVGGSYNYTLSAERRNAENVTFTQSAQVAAWYLGNWNSRLTYSRAYAPPG